MKKLIKNGLIILVSLIPIIIVSCYTSTPYIQFSKELSISDSLATVAVLNFEYGGLFLSSKISKTAADDLTSELFIKKNISVVDRSLVKATLKKYEKSKPERLSREELKTIGQELKASYLILGSLQSLGSIEEYYSSRDKNVNITIRILDSTNGDVIGIIKHSAKGDDDIEVIVKRLIKETVFFL